MSHYGARISYGSGKLKFASIHSGAHVTKRPFSLEYLAYEQAIWKNGQVDRLPPNWPGEPQPYGRRHTYIPYMKRKKYRIATRLSGPRYNPYFSMKPMCVKECMISKGLFKRFILSKPGHDTCWLCFISKYYPHLENSPPEPLPTTYCVKRPTRRHFINYIYSDSLLRRPPRRKCTLKIKKYSK